MSSSDAARIRELEQANRELRRANEVLKRAASFFVAELDRQWRSSGVHRRPARRDFRGSPAGGRAHLLDSAGGPEQLLRPQDLPLSARAHRDAELIPQLIAIWRDNYSVYGARKLWKSARRAGLNVGRDQVDRLMRGRDRRSPAH